MACTVTPDRSVMASWKVRDGVAAYLSAVTPVQPKIRSATSVLPFPDRWSQCDRPLPQPGQERFQRRAGLGPAVEPLPVQPELADQGVAHVDGDQEDLVLVHEDGLGVRGQPGQQRVADGEPVPRLEVELALGDPARARVARHHPAQRRVVEEEGHRDRDLEFVPVRGGQRPFRVAADPLGHRPVPAPRRPLVGEQQVAGPAGAGDGPFVHVDQVPVPAAENRAAELAPLRLRLALNGSHGVRGRLRPARRADEPAQAHRVPWSPTGRLVIWSNVGSAGGWMTSTTTPAASGAAPVTALEMRSLTVSAEQPRCSSRSRSTPDSSRPRYSTSPACEPSCGSTSSTARRTRVLVSSGCRSCTSSRLSTSGSATSESITPGSQAATISVILASPAPYSSTRQLTSSSAVAAACGPAWARSSARSCSTRSPTFSVSLAAAITSPAARRWGSARS